MKHKIMLFGALAALASASAAYAADGPYVGLLAGSTKFTVSDSDGSESRFTWGANAGYRFNPYVAAELGYYKPSSLKESEAGESAKLSNTTLAASALLGAPISGNFSAYARLGAARTKLKLSYSGAEGSLSASDSSTELLWGAGVAANFGNTSVRGEFTRVDTDFIDGSLISLGFTWSFGR
jgi:opacity protein-like surface antigen